MPKKVIATMYLLLKQDKDGNLTARQVNEDATTGQFAYGDALVNLDANERAAAKNLVKSLQGKLEA